MTILETIPIMEQPGNYLPFLRWGFVLFLIFAAFSILNVDTLSDSIVVIAAIIAVIALSIGVYGLIRTIIEPEIDTGRVKYIIKVDDTQCLNEFYNKYKILEHTQYTDVYTVEELND